MPRAPPRSVASLESIAACPVRAVRMGPVDVGPAARPDVSAHTSSIVCALQGWEGMYRCQLCGVIAPPRTPSYVVVLETRPRTYPLRPKAFRVVERSGGRRKLVEKDDPGGTGYETVAEVRVCPTCHGNHPPVPSS